MINDFRHTGPDQNNHMCFIYESHEEWYDTIIPFMKSGIERGDKCMYIIDSNTEKEIKEHFEKAQVKIDEKIRSGQFTIIHESAVYNRTGSFDPDKMIEIIAKETRKTISEGYPALRVTGEMTWILKGHVGSESALEYEAKLNSNFFPEYPCIAVCQYDRRRFDPDIIKSILMTHPLLIKGSRVYHNPYYISPEMFLSRKRSQHEVQHWLNNIYRRRKLHEQQHRISESAPFGIALIEKDGTYGYINPKFTEILGYDLSDIPNGKQWFTKAYPDASYRHEAISAWFNDLKTAKIGEQKPRVFTVACKDGTQKIINMITVLFENGENMVTIEDITAQRQTEETLKTSEARYRSIFENVVEGIFQINPEGEYISANPSLARLLGFDSPLELIDLVNMTAGQFFADPQDHKTFIASLKAEKIIKDFEAQILKKDGAAIWASLTARAVIGDKGEALYYEGSIVDITEKKRAEDSLKQSERRLLNIIEHLPDATFAIDNNGCVIVWNRAIEEMTGCPAENIIGKGNYEYATYFYGKRCPVLANYLSSNDIEIIKRYLYVKLDGDTLYAETDVPCIHGHKRTLWVKASPLRDEQGNVVGAIESIRDITDHKRLEAQYLQSQKMESVGRLAGGVAHDFNNMLSVIQGHAEMAMYETDQANPLRNRLMKIQKAAQRAADLPRQLLAFARKQTISPKVVALNEIIEGMLKMIEHLIGENIDLAWLPSDKVWPVKMDPSQIDQILANMCINARDAISNVGKITIETEVAVFDEAYCANHLGYVPGEYVMLAVSDNGCGMDKETIDKLFEPFFTTKEFGKGTGLGLSTVYGIVKQNNGFINVYSEPNQGTTFRIYFPRYQGVAESFEAKDTIKSPVIGNETILLVEDETSTLDITATLLGQIGYTVYAVSTPEEAIALAKENTGKIQLLMTDVVMPKMNGRELARTLLTICPGIKTLFTSGYTANVIAHHGILDEGLHFIQKPYSLNDLSTKLRDLLDNR